MANDLDDIIKINVIVFINFLKNFILKLDDLSWNYNPQASIDDGSCFEIPDCNTGQNLVELQISFDSFSKNFYY